MTTRPPAPSPYSTFARIGAVCLLSMASLAACGSSKSTSAAATSVESATTVTVSETKPAETKPAETKPAETTPAETKPAEVAPAETKPADSTPAASSAATAAVGDTTLIASMIQNMTGQTPQDADIECVSSKISATDMAAMVSEGADSRAATEKVFSALFGCNPTGLGARFAESTFSDTPGITDEQKTCLGEKLVKIIGSSPEIISAIAGDAKNPPPSFVTGAKKAINECVQSGAERDKLIASLTK